MSRNGNSGFATRTRGALPPERTCLQQRRRIVHRAFLDRDHAWPGYRAEGLSSLRDAQRSGATRVHAQVSRAGCGSRERIDDTFRLRAAVLRGEPGDVEPGQIDLARVA